MSLCLNTSLGQQKFCILGRNWISDPHILAPVLKESVWSARPFYRLMCEQGIQNSLKKFLFLLVLDYEHSVSFIVTFVKKGFKFFKPVTPKI